MGLGVVDPLGGSPGTKWQLRIRLVDSERVRDAAFALLAGEAVVSSDNAVQISWTGDGVSRGKIRIRDASTTATYLLDIQVEALGTADVGDLEPADPRGVAAGVPGPWTAVVSETTETWELYNCCILSVAIVKA